MKNGILNEEVYVHQPPGFKVKEQENKVYKLKEPTSYIKEDGQDSDFAGAEYVASITLAWLKIILIDFG